MCDHEKEICEKNIQQPQLQLGDDQWESVKWKLENYTSGGFGQNREKTSGMELKEWLRMDMTVQHMVTIIYEWCETRGRGAGREESVISEDHCDAG